MNYKIVTVSLLAAALLPIAASGQFTRESAETRRSTETSEGIGPLAGAGELMLGGSGGADTDFDDSFGGFSGSLGFYINDNLMWAVRQSVNYSNPDTGPRAWNGSTRLALDHHFRVGREELRPFVGVTFGRVYGDTVNDTWAAGLELGAKYYVQPRTFVSGMAEYQWFFRNASSIDNSFDDGSILWSVGLGFNF